VEFSKLYIHTKECTKIDGEVLAQSLIHQITYQALQLVKEEEMVITITQIDVEEVNISTSDETQQFTQTGSPNVGHKYQEPIEKLNMLLFNTPKNIVNAFGIIDWVTKEGWLQIPRWQANKKLVRILNDDGSICRNPALRRV
jgi:hypothetical protein